MTVLHTTNHFESTTLTSVKTPDDGTQGVPKHVGGNSCIRFVYASVHVRLVLYMDFDTMHGTRNIKRRLC